MKENIRRFVDAHKGELISIGVVAGLTGLAFVVIDIRSKLNIPQPPKMGSVTFDELEKHCSSSVFALSTSPIMR